MPGWSALCPLLPYHHPAAAMGKLGRRTEERKTVGGTLFWFLCSETGTSGSELSPWSAGNQDELPKYVLLVKRVSTSVPGKANNNSCFPGL